MRRLFVFSILLILGGCRDRKPETKTGVTVNTGDKEDELPHATMVARAMEELRIKTASFDRLFQLGRADWQLDQDTGIIEFTSPKGLVATAPAQIVGSFNLDDKTWLWSWDNPSVEPALTAHAKLTQRYGQQRGIPELTTRKMVTTEEKAWEMTALTCKLGGYQGAYRGPAGQTMVFITFGDVQLQKQKQKQKRR